MCDLRERFLKRSGASMRYHVRLTERAARDLETIYEFIGADTSDDGSPLADQAY